MTGDTDSAKDLTRRKFDHIGARYSARYADPGAIAAHQVALVQRWGTRLPRGASALEIGCADGLVTEALSRAGLKVTAVDLSPGILSAARARLADVGLEARFVEADVDTLDLQEPFDVVLFFFTFFHYAAAPEATLARLAAHTGTKLLVDLDPRETPLQVGLDAVRGAGFDHVSWRLFLVPHERRLPLPALMALSAAGRVPGLRRLPLRWKGNVVIKGERRHAWRAPSPPAGSGW